jgi:selenocysteine lyase/cysteine desulfurase
VTCNALLGPADHAIIETPCFESAIAIPRSTGAEVSAWRRSFTDGWAHDLGSLEKLLRPSTRLIYINSPHNPTGTRIPRIVLERVIELAAEYQRGSPVTRLVGADRLVRPGASRCGGRAAVRARVPFPTAGACRR